MLIVTVDEQEFYNEVDGEFQTIKAASLQLEHSLVSISKWESKWKKPFLSSEKTKEESMDYIRCMTINSNVPDYIYNFLSHKQIEDISKYISDPMTATTIKQVNKKQSRRIITAEVIYSWMFQMNIPFECRKWHLNKLMTLIGVCAESQNPEKMSKREIMQQNRSLNAQRKAALGTRG